MLRRAPISIRLALWYGLTLLLLLSAFAVFCYAGFHVALHRSFDRHLTHEQRQLLPYIAVDAGGPAFERLETLKSVAYQTEGVYGTYVRLLGPRGEVRYASPNHAASEPLPVILPEALAETTESRTWGGLPARTRYVPLRDGGSDTHVGWLEVTGFEWSQHRDLAALRRMLIGGVVGSVLLALGGGWWLARRTLRPVAAMTAGAARIGARTLGERLPEDFGTRDELTELAETFNDLLERLERSVQRERRFTADAAHELLTPLATLRSEAEVTLRRDRSPEDYRDALARLLHDVETMTATVGALLQLARADTATKDPADRLDLSALAREAVASAEQAGTGKSVRLSADIAPGVVVAAKPAPLREVLGNLLGNAVKYSAPGSVVRLRLSHGGGAALITVEDDGPGFEPESAERLFDRFYRSDAPEVQAQQGSGLGLSIVKAIVERYGGSVTATSAGLGEGARFTVCLPCLACPPSSSAPK